MMQAAASGISEMKSSEMGGKQLLTIAKENVDKAEEFAITSARYFLDRHVIAYFLTLIFPYPLACTQPRS